MTDNYCPKCRHLLGEPRYENYKVCYNCNIKMEFKIGEPYILEYQKKLGDF